MSNNNNNWIAHVKAFAAKNNISYACAVSMPECKATYKKEEVVKPVKEKKTKKERKETKKIKVINKNILEAVALTPKKRKIIIKKKAQEVPVVVKEIKTIKIKKEKNKKPLTNQKIIKMIKSIRESMSDSDVPIDKAVFRNKNLFLNSLRRYERRRKKIMPDLEKLNLGAIKDYIENRKVDLNELAEIQNEIIDNKIFDIIKEYPEKYETSAAAWAKLYIQQNKLKMTFDMEDSEED